MLSLEEVLPGCFDVGSYSVVGGFVDEDAKVEVVGWLTVCVEELFNLVSTIPCPNGADRLTTLKGNIVPSSSSITLGLRSAETLFSLFSRCTKSLWIFATSSKSETSRRTSVRVDLTIPGRVVEAFVLAFPRYSILLSNDNMKLLFASAN